MAEAATSDAFLRRYLIARVDGTDVPVEAWETTRPQAGQLVQFIVRAGNGDFLRTILQIAVVAAAVWVSAGALAGVLGPGFAAGTFGAALASAAVAIAGNLLINALVPLEVPGQDSRKQSPFFTVTGARNSARLYEPAPLVLGKHRMFPPLWGQPIQETVGDDVYLRIPFCFGPAPMQISDVKIGETPITSYAGVELETRLLESDPQHLLYAGDLDQDAVGAAITTSFQSRNSAPDVDELEVVFGFANGLGGVDSKGRKVSKTVTFEVQYRVAGSGGAWASVRPDAVQASAAAAAAGQPDRTLDSLLFVDWLEQAAAQVGTPSGPFAVTRADAGKGFQHRIRWAVPRAAAGYEVQVRRTTAESTDNNTVDAVTWAILGSRKSFVDPFPNRKLASGVLRIKATDQLNGVIDTFNFVAEPLVPVFSSGALADPSTATAGSLEAPAISRNPAHLILNVYRGPQNARPRPDSKIDWPSFARFAKFCADKGLHFDEVVDGALTRAELARRIAQAGFGRLHKWGGKLAVAIDRLRTGELPAQTFTPRNIANLKWRKSFPAKVHAVHIAFANAANGYQADEVTLYLDGYDASNATLFERLQVPGKTDADEVRIVGRQYINNSLRQLEQFSFDMDAEALTCMPGAYALLQHDVLGTGLGAQRVKSLVMVGGDVVGFMLDHPIATEAGPALACRWRQLEESGGQAWFEAKDEVAITRDADDARLFMFDAPRDPAEAPTVGDMVLVGEVEQVALEVLVRDISPDVGFRASLTVIPYAPERFTPDGEELPPHDPKVTLPIGGRPAQPLLLSVKAGTREIALSFAQPASPRGITLQGFDVAVREHGTASDAWTPVGQLAADERVAIAPAGDPEATYDVFVQAFGRDTGGITVYSDPLIVEDIAAAGAPAAPVSPSAVFETRTSSAGAQQIVLKAAWTANEDPDVLDTVVEQRISTGPDVWLEIGRGRAAAGRTEVHGLAVGRSYTLGFLNLSRRGIASERVVIDPVVAPDTLVSTYAMEAAPGGPLDVALDAVSEALDGLGGDNFPGFTIIGGHGDIDIEANVDAPSDIKVSAGYLDHWTLGKIDVDETQFGTAWGELFAPAQGFFGLAWSEQPVAERFGNGAGAGHIFPFAYDADGVTVRAYGLDRNAGEAFTPALTDMVIGRALKPRAAGSDELSSADGVTHVDNYIRDTTVVNARFSLLEASVGAASASVEELTVALADEVSTRAAQTTTLTANLGTANSNITANATAIASEASTRASQVSTLTANLGTANANIATNASAIATETATRASETATLTANLSTANANIATNATAIATEAAARASADSTLTTNLATANANIATNASAISAESTARASAISTLTANVGSLSTSVSTNATAIAALDGRMSAFWGIKVAAGTNIATIEAMASGGGVPSSVIITAGQIGLHGDVVVTGTLSTPKFAANAITQGGIHEVDTLLTLTTSYQTLATRVVTVPDALTEVKLDWSAYFKGVNQNTGADSTVTVAIYRDATLIYETPAVTSAQGFTFDTDEGPIMIPIPFAGQVSGFDGDIPGAGTITYTFKAKRNDVADASWEVSSRRFFSTLFKR